METLKEKLSHETQQLNRHLSLYEQANLRARSLEDDKSHLEHRLHKTDVELSTCELSREGLKRDKSTVCV